MKKASLFLGAVLGLALGAHAQLKGVGYNDGLKQITARLAIGPNDLDIGAGFAFDNSVDKNKFSFGASGTFLGHLHDWGPVDTYFAAGLVFQKLPQDSKDIAINLFGGFQPEVTLLDHIAVSARFGLDVPVAPDVKMMTAGPAGISIIGGGNFTILF